jgi:hypothetical protein
MGGLLFRFVFLEVAGCLGENPAARAPFLPLRRNVKIQAQQAFANCA